MLQTIDPFPGHYDAADPFGSLAGNRRYGHTGADWNRGIGGEPIPAWAAGIVVANQWSNGNGNCLAISIDESPLYFSSIHMAEASPLPVGTRVALGDYLGIVGNTGTNSIGAHYHSSLSDSRFVFLGQGNLQDPWEFIQAHLTTLADLETQAGPDPEIARRKIRQNVALPLIAQQGVPGDDQYGLNIVVWDDGTYYWVDGAQRDVWLDAGASFLDCTIPGRFEFVVSDAEARKAIHQGQRVADAKAGAHGALGALIIAARAENAPLLAVAADTPARS